MTDLADVLPLPLLGEMLEGGYVRRQTHPTLPLAILNYTEKATYDRVWNDATRACRGLIYETTDPSDGGGRVVARPFPKFFNYGEHAEPVRYDLSTHRKVYPASDTHHLLNLDAPAFVTDKLDGSLGILYPTGAGDSYLTADRYAIATRGSFTSEQALHATEVWRDRYATFVPAQFVTYLFEIVYPGNRIVCDYGDLDDLILLAALDIRTGRQLLDPRWPGLRAETFRYQTLADALRAEPRPNAEGLVVYLPETGERVKIKQDDYVALHRILTGTNARNVWEVVAVQTCASLIRDPKHWGSYLGIDSARAEQVLELGDEWLAGVPDEFYSWVDATIAEANESAMRNYVTACHLADEARAIADRRARFERVSGSVFAKEVMRLASAEDAEAVSDALGGLLLRCWREACPEPTAPFARSEAVA